VPEIRLERDDGREEIEAKVEAAITEVRRKIRERGGGASGRADGEVREGSGLSHAR
jgi:hypothetical protein